MNVACWVVLHCCSRVIDIMRTLILHRLRHFYHAKPDGLQVPCQMPYYIYKHHLEHQAIYGHEISQQARMTPGSVAQYVVCIVQILHIQNGRSVFPGRDAEQGSVSVLSGAA